MKTPIKYSEKKLTELMLYVGGKCALDEHYGVLKLNKILFYSDFKAFEMRGKPITGAEYRKYPHGPAPAVMKSLKAKIEKLGDAIEYQNPHPHLGADGKQMTEKRFLPIRKAELNGLLEPDEIAIVDGVIEWLRPMTGSAVSRMSHDHPGWHFAAMEDSIPYVSALLTKDGAPPLSAKDMAKAKQFVDDFTKSRASK